MTSETVGVVLAGGAGSRMGGDKAALRIDGRTLAERALAVLEEVFPEVLLSVAEPAAAKPGAALVVDRRPACGPLGGIEAALEASGSRPLFVLACDLPLVTSAVVRHIVARAGSAVASDEPAAWVASEDGRWQPLCGLYSAATREQLRLVLERGERSVMGLLDRLATTAVPVDELGENLLLNLNRPADLTLAEELLHEA